MNEDSEDSGAEGCTYNKCDKHLPLNDIRSKDLKDDFNVTYKGLNKEMKDHYGRYHKDSPVIFDYPIEDITRKMEVRRNSEVDWNYVCVCRKFYRDRASVQRHFKDCKYLKKLAPYIAIQIQSGPISIPLPFDVPPPIKHKRKKSKVEDSDINTDIIQSTTMQLLHLQKKVAEQEETIQRMQKELEQYSHQHAAMQQLKQQMEYMESKINVGYTILSQLKK
ncbi:hypothetical protein BX616_003204 [Lobosporangium transversale]|uniref:Uncharacterized protein n=1 Tax=Lobosporangium transversale TaxID=64571 RepID=A0A1Y2GHS7_9FUNG|nr:hypothetical protein BCR41DRAFT_358124 [Lobosporangium transversale]KAF9899166.1 hypothetical protein BX616_003204 [Lobosporangium transversale]ORZ10021.1 hypothetical protein BCR41DRAFT_358124 [Lobosporangium transversale]|eukprot:XP_021879111.1 hypothetical protein BCR41DRAFT_358124 [Lobosporangium transversale]